MNQEETAVDVFPVFPTPIIVREIPNFHKVKNDLVKDVYDHDNYEVENIFNLLRFQKYFPLIYDEIETSLSPVIDDMNRMSPSSIVRSDVSIIKPNQYIKPCVRSEYDMTGILVVDCPFRLSGDFVFLSQPHNHSFYRILNVDMKNRYCSSDIRMPSADGRMIIFPSTLTYYGETNKTDMDKIVITFDIKL